LAATWVAMRLKSGNARDSFGPGTRIGPEFRDMMQIGISARASQARPELALGFPRDLTRAGNGSDKRNRTASQLDHQNSFV
jgi:hypothetical protein